MTSGVFHSPETPGSKGASLGFRDAATVIPEGTEVHTGEACLQWSVGGVAPQAVALPRTAEEAAQILKAAGEAGVRVAPAGAGRWMAARGARPVELVISTERMAEVTLYEPADLTLTAGAGLTLATLARKTVPNRQFLALDPPGSGTLGGLVSTAAAGPLRAYYGTPREHVLGVTLVTGDGRVLQLGGRVVKNVAGFDLLKLVVGGWGAFGLITSVTTRLYPIPARDVSLVYRGEREAILDLARKLGSAPFVPAALEIVDDVRADGLASTFIAIRLFGSPASTAAAAQVFESAAGRPPDERVSGTESSALASVVRAAGSAGQVTVTIAARPEQTPDLLREIAARLPAYTGGAHLADGVVRLGWDVRDAAVELTAIQGVADAYGARMKMLTGPRSWASAKPLRSPAVQRILDGLKAEFDPRGVLWPGRFGGSDR